MYYRKTSYPESGHADVPDDLWMEFQRIREHLSGVDQNNVAPDTIGRDLIAPPSDREHSGISDIVGVDGNFLYKEQIHVPPSMMTSLRSEDDGAWYDLGQDGLRLKALSRGDAPWIVGASVSAVLVTEARVALDTRSLYVETSGLGHAAQASNKSRALTYTAEDWQTAYDEEQRGTLHLRIRSSQGGLSAAESVGGITRHQFGCSLATVACFFVRGGPVEFSPNVLLRSHLNSSSWILRVVEANIFAFGLYR